MTNYGQARQPAILGVTTLASAKIHDDDNGTLYVEYVSPSDVYRALSDWQSKHPGRTISSSTFISAGAAKYSAVIFTYTGR